MERLKIQSTVFGHLCTLTTLYYNLWYALLFLPVCIYWNRDIVICFKEVLKES